MARNQGGEENVTRSSRYRAFVPLHFSRLLDFLQSISVPLGGQPADTVFTRVTRVTHDYAASARVTRGRVTVDRRRRWCTEINEDNAKKKKCHHAYFFFSVNEFVLSHSTNTLQCNMIRPSLRRWRKKIL